MRCLTGVLLVAACGGGGGDSQPDAAMPDASVETRCIQHVEVGAKICVVRRDHTVWCGTPLVRSTVWGDDVAEVDADASCARKVDGSVWCVPVGGGTPAFAASPPEVVLTGGVIQLGGRSNAHCAVKADH